MNWDGFEPLATTVLYEGHVLYPYRPSALKNQQRWNFGTLFPPAVDGEPHHLHLEILIECDLQPLAGVRFCFLQGEHVRQFDCTAPGEQRFHAAPADVQIAAALSSLAPGLWRLTAEAGNRTEISNPAREAAFPQALQSAQLRCALDRGSFVSAQDPGERLAAQATACRCEGVYPVLVGPPGARSLLLASPLILEDWAKVAPQSHGDFCDAAEMDELLTLRVLTLSAEEQEEVMTAGGTGRKILERCHRLSPDGPALELHGGRVGDGIPWDPFTQPPASVPCAGGELRAGVRVRLHPRPGPDLFTSLLDGKTARVQAIEQDLEGEVHLAVVVDDDPGADLGEARQSGHRFFFALFEVELL